MIRSGVMSASAIAVGRLAQTGLGKVEEQHEGITIGGNGLRAERPLLGQVLGKVGLHERGE